MDLWGPESLGSAGKWRMFLAAAGAGAVLALLSENTNLLQPWGDEGAQPWVLGC